MRHLRRYIPPGQFRQDRCLPRNRRARMRICAALDGTAISLHKRYGLAWAFSLLRDMVESRRSGPLGAGRLRVPTVRHGTGSEGGEVSKRPTTGTGKISRLRLPVGLLRDLPIWSKLGLIMIVPTIATVIVGTAGLVGNIQKANDADRARTLSGLSAQAAVLVPELQNERAAAVLLLGTPDTQSQTGFDRQTPITDDAARGYRLRRTALADLPTSFRTQLNAIDES